MRMSRVGLIRVLSTRDRKLLNAHGEMIMRSFPCLEVESRCIEDQPEGVHDEATEALAVPKVIELARSMEHEGFEAVIVSCAGDPGVERLASILSVPVVGAGRAAAAAARSLGLPVGVLGLTRVVPGEVRRILGGFLVADAVPDGVTSTLDLMSSGGRDAVLRTGGSLKAQGAAVLLLACTGLSTIGAAVRLRGSLGIPVIDPVLAEGAMACLALSAVNEV